MNRQSVWAWAMVPALGALAGCVPAGEIGPVLGVQREAIARIRRAYEQDLSLLADQAVTLSQARRTLVMGRVHRELIARGYITPELTPDPGAFERDLGDASIEGVLVREVRDGRLSRRDAEDFIHDFALALRMTREGGRVRGEMLSRLSPIQSLDRDRAAADRALDERRRSVMLLLDEAAGVNASLDEYSRRADPTVSDRSAPGSASWRELFEQLARSSGGEP